MNIRVDFSFNPALSSVGPRACFVINIAKDDGIRGTSLLAGGLDLAIPDPALIFFCGNASGVDPLHAVGALFHDAAAAPRNIRIAPQLQAWRVIVCKQEEVEPPPL